MTRVRVLKPFEYARRMLAVGDEIECEDHFVLPLKLSGKVEAVDDEPQQRKRYRRRDLRVEE